MIIQTMQAELKNAPGRICFVLKFSLGKKRYIMIKNDHKCKKCKEKTDRCKKYMFILEDWFKAIYMNGIQGNYQINKKNQDRIILRSRKVQYK